MGRRDYTGSRVPVRDMHQLLVYLDIYADRRRIPQFTNSGNVGSLALCLRARTIAHDFIAFEVSLRSAHCLLSAAL